MHRAMLCLLLGAAFVALTPGCGGDDGGGVPSGGSRDTVTGTPDGGGGVIPGATASGATDLPTSGNATVDDLIAAAVACGALSPNTVPAGWSMVMVTSSGCSQQIPPGWSTDGGPDDLTMAPDASGQTAVFTLATAPEPGSSCAPRGLVTALLPLFADETGATDVTELAYDQGEIVGVPWGHAAFSYRLGGTPGIGYVRVIAPASAVLGTCSLAIMGYWLPQANVTHDLCTLLQIFESARCPQGGTTGCVDTDCRAACQSQGYETGDCGATGSCTCR